MHRVAGRDRFAGRGRAEKYLAEPPKLPKEIDQIIVDPSTRKRYLRGRFLGKGGFAKCYELTDMETKQTFAGKIVPKTMLTKPHQKEKMSMEIKIHRALGHKHIVGFQGFFEDEDYVYIILEICRRRSLMELHKRRRPKALTEPEVRYYMKQIVDSCVYLHQNKIIHRDLKLGNLFLNDDMEIKVGDFGLATKVESEGERKKTLCGTPNYIAPEVLNKKGHSYEVDVWSLGCIMYTLLVGKPPFETSSLKETYMRIKRNEYLIPSKVGHTAQLLIIKLLRPDPSTRPTMEEIMNDDFFTKGYIPSRLPVSCLTTEPRFPRESIATYQTSRKPLTELNSRESESNGAVKIDPRNKRKSLGVRVIAGEISQMVLPGQNGADELQKQEQDIPSDWFLSQLHQQLSSCLASKPSVKDPKNFDEAEDPAMSPVYWVGKWVDYSDKYGLGYQLSDCSVGVLFNDTTRLILAEDGENLVYILDGGETAYTMKEDYSHLPDLAKKIKLLKYFHNYMNDHLLKAGGDRAVKDGDELARLPYLREWFRTKHAIVLHLSNGSMQINFFKDHTKLILCPRMAAVTYIDEKKNFRTFPLKNIEQHGCCKEIVCRLQYAKTMVERLKYKTSAINPVESAPVLAHCGKKHSH